MILLGACGDPLATMPRYSEADVADDPGLLSVRAAPESDEEAETAQSGGFFARLLQAPVSEPASDPQADNTSDSADGASSDPAVDDADVPLPPETYGATRELPEAAAPQRGFFGLFSRGGAASSATRQQGSSATALPPGARLPYGEIATACNLSKSDLGKRVAQYPEKRPRHVLYDTDPGNTAPHTFYLTGFADGCARQFTASLALFGSVGMHEQLRYGLPAQVQPYSDTDKAYEKVKSRVCGVPRKKPCGSKLNRLEDNTVFLSVYESFGDIDRWSNLLLHAGQVVARDIKG